jgi:hypothetical protein
MATLRLTDEQKNILKRYNALLMAVADEGIFWEAYAGDDYVDSLEGPYPEKGDYYNRADDIQPNSEGAELLTTIIADYTDRIRNEIMDLHYCDECTGGGTFRPLYDPHTMTFNLIAYYGVKQGEETVIEKPFDEVSQDTPTWNFGDQSKRPHKKLNNDEFVQSMIDHNNGKTNFEFTYNGYGDSGQIEGGDVEWGNPVLELAYDILDLYHSGWENSDGSDGQIIIDLENKEIQLYHTSYYSEDEEEDLGELKLI